MFAEVSKGQLEAKSNQTVAKFASTKQQAKIGKKLI